MSIPRMLQSSSLSILAFVLAASLLSVAPLGAKRDARPQPGIPLLWQVVGEDPNYPTDEIIVAALQVTDSRLRPPLPGNPAAQDCTATFQNAIDTVWAGGGGTVFVPEGEYLFQGSLNLRQNVTLRGRWQGPRRDGWLPGSVLKVAPGKASGEGSPFLTIEKETGLKELSFYYPDQRPEAVKPYPFTIYAGQGTNTLQNLTFVNSYRGLHAKNAAMSVFRGLYGTPLETGVIAGNGVALPRIEVVEFSPDPWAWWPLDHAAAAPAKEGNYAWFMRRNGVAFRLREMDGFAWFHANISGYKVGLVTEDDEGTAGDEGSAPHGVGFHVRIHGCRTGMQIRRGDIIWHDSQFEGIEEAVQSVEHGGATFHGCTIGGGEQAVRLAESSTTQLHMVGCRIGGGIEALGKNRLELRDCDLAAAILDGAISDRTSLRALGCRHEGRPLELRTRSNVRVDPVRTPRKPPPVVGLDYRTDWKSERKPAKADLFLVTEDRFAGGAKGDLRSDDTAAVRAAIEAAKQNGGGIVFFPSGYYRITGNLDLGRGVELRGAAGARYTAGSGISGGTPHLMSVLLVEAEGPADGEPFLTLGDGSGVRHLLFFYPEQNWKRLMVDDQGFKEFPFTVAARGTGNYLISCSAPNPYQFADFDGARDFLVEFCLTGGIRTVYRVGGGASGGRIQTGHIKPSGFMGSLTDIKNVAANRGRYGNFTAPVLEAFQLNDCTDITLSGIFARTAHRVLTVNGASGRGIMIGGEELQNGFVFEKEGKELFDLIECGMNAGSHGDKTGKDVILLGKGFGGSVWCHGGHFGGTSDYLYRVLSGNLTVVDATTPNYGYRSPRAIMVGDEGRLELQRSGVSREWSLTVASGGQARMESCVFPEGFPVGDIRGKLDLQSIDSPGKLIICAPGQLQFDEQGLVLDRTGTRRVDQDRSWAQLLERGDSFRLDVRSADFTDGKASRVTMNFMLYVEAPCKVAVSYAAKDGLRQAALSGRQATRPLSPGFHRFEATVEDARFGSGTEDIVLKLAEGAVDKVRPALTMVSVLKGNP